MRNIIYEAMNSFYIGTQPGSGARSNYVGVTWNGGLDDGLNGGSGGGWKMNFFEIHPLAKGFLTVTDHVFSRGCGYFDEDPASFIYRNVTAASSAEPNMFEVLLERVTLRDWSWFGDKRGYFAPGQGIDVEMKDVRVNSWSVISIEERRVPFN